MFKIYDPYVRTCRYTLEPDITSALKDSDCAVILTDHSEFKSLDPSLLRSLMRNRTIIDTRNILGLTDANWSDFQIYTLGISKQ